MKRRGLPILIVLILILLVGAAGTAVHLIQKYTPTEERMDPAAYYGVMEDETQIPLIFGTQVLEERGLVLEGEVYLPQNVVHKYLNKRFYWDGGNEIMIYTTPTERIVVKPGTVGYKVNGEESGKEDYTICTQQKEKLYINVKYVQKYSDIDFQFFQEPNRLVVQYQWDEVPTVEVKEDQAAVRYRGGIKSEILTNVAKGSTLRLIEQLEDWSHVATEDGFIGYIKKDEVSDGGVINYDREFVEPEYTSIKRDYPINLTWHQVMSEMANDTLDDVMKNVTGVNVISPTWFSIANNKGDITNFATESYVTKAHQMGLEVWGLVDNFSESIDTYQVLKDSRSRTNLVHNLVRQAVRFSLEGINIDFETLTEETGPHFIQFLRELSILCRKEGLVLSVDNPLPEDNNYTYHYDREAQGEVVDYVIIMGYDEHFMGSEEAGSVASLPWVEEGIINTLKEVPAEKVINGIPFYTRLWKTSAGVVTSEAITMDQQDEVVAKYKVETYWDEDYGQNYAEYEQDNFLCQMWMEDEESIAAKMKLIKKYELAGVASWKLGFERPSVWKIISQGLE